MKSKQILDELRRQYNLPGYATVSKELVLDYLSEKERIQREREARYKSDIANAESFALLKEQVRTLKEQAVTFKEMSEASSLEARKARTWAMTATILSVIATILAAFIPYLLTSLI